MAATQTTTGNSRLTVLMLSLGLVTMAGTACRPRSTDGSGLAAAGAHTDRLTADNLYEFMEYGGGSSRYHGYVKASWPVETGGGLSGQWFQNRDYKFHADFLTTLPQFQGLDRIAIDRLSLHKDGRRVMLGVLLVRREGDLSHPGIDLELLSHDPLPASDVKRVIDRIKSNHTGFLDDIAYSPVAEQRSYVQAHAADFEALGIKIADQTPDQDQICYASGWTVGRVRIAKAADLPAMMAGGTLTEEDILILDEAPRELPLVAGVVVAQTSSPASHVALLMQMADKPYFYQRNATASPRWQALAAQGTPVFLSNQGAFGTCEVNVLGQGDVTAAEAARLRQLKRPAPLDVQMYDESPDDVIDLDDLGRQDRLKVGAKAANVAELRRVIPENTITEGMGVPIAFFARALRATPAGAQVAAELAAISGPDVPLSAVIAGLEKIRATIAALPVPPELATRVLAGATARWPVGTRIKLRSSSNVEDNQDFNGAGLYDSAGACVGDDQRTEGSGCAGETKPKPVLKALTKVWASLYTLKGFLARRFYSIDERRVGMGVLVQQSFKGELANGVALTVKRPQWAGDEPQLRLTVNGFPGEDLEVTNPPVGKIPETTVIDQDRVDLMIPTTELPTGRTLMDEKEYRELWKITDKVHDHYAAGLPDAARHRLELDLEWKLIEDGGGRKPILKQVRPVPVSGRLTGQKGRGTHVVANRQAGLLCPQPSEDSDGLRKLLSSFAIQATVGMHELPLAGATAIPTPLEKLAVATGTPGTFTPVTLPAQARVSQEGWYDGQPGERSRVVTACVPVSAPGLQPVSLCWGNSQTTDTEAPEYLREAAVPFTSTAISLRSTKLPVVGGQPGEFGLTYAFVAGATACEGDAWQGQQPGTVRPGWIGGDRQPVARTEVYPAAGAGKLALRINQRTAVGGFDKTTFQHVDEFCVKGVLARELCVKTPLKSVYAAAHHNFSWQYASDLYFAEGLTADERKQLQSKKVRYVVFPVGTTAQGAKVAGLSETFKAKQLGVVRLSGPVP